MGRITIFLSHSSKDIEKVRKIRDILETIGYEPLMFYLKCLDDENEILEDFIKQEIEARNIFIYCKSKQAEESEWVQKELEYIRSFSTKRLYEIDIERPLRDTLIGLLQSIAEILKRNRVFLSCSHADHDRLFGDSIEAFLQDKGYDVCRFRTLDYSKEDEYRQALFDITENGVFIPVISYNSTSSVYCMSELETALDSFGRDGTLTIAPLFFNISREIAYEKCPTLLKSIEGIEVELTSSNFEGMKEKLLELIK